MSLVARSTLAVASMTLALVGCRDSTAPNDAARSLGVRPSISRVPADAAPLDSHIVAPRTTDPAINRALAPHYVWLDRTARSNRKLLVFMPGANNQPVGWRLLEKEAARMGYHVIGLMYQNDVAVVEKCNGSDDALCSENMRLEVLDGVDRTDRVDVSPANSIDNRLTKLLVWLDENYAHEGWSQFLEDGAPDWRRIVVS